MTKGASHPSIPAVPPEKAADRSRASGTVDDLQTVAKVALGSIPKVKRSKSEDRKTCPECGHVFKGNGWDGIDAHWKSKHGKVMPYEEAWPLLQAGTYKPRTPAVKFAADTARYEALAREHGADLSEEGFNDVLRKVGKKA